MTAGLLAGKRGLIMGVANERSSAWGIAAAAAEAGAELAFTYQMAGFGKRLRPLAESVGSDLIMECDVAHEGAIGKAFDWLAGHWSSVDFVVHALAFSDKNELKGSYLNTSRQNFNETMMISAFSFTEVAQAARQMMPDGGSLVTLSYIGAQRISPNYNVMGVAKAALEASVRYLAVDLGGQNIRVNALSAGPMKTLAGAAITGARHIYRYAETAAPLGRNPDINEVGHSGLYLVSDLSSGVTGEVHFVDGGFNTIATPPEDTE
jgi:enoyl-[acyl-carrier protein] reductase I